MDVEGDFFLMCWREILLSSELYGETYIEERNIVLEPTVIYSVIIIIRIVKSGIRIGNQSAVRISARNTPDIFFEI